jgi:hypothetical protein
MHSARRTAGLALVASISSDGFRTTLSHRDDTNGRHELRARQGPLTPRRLAVDLAAMHAISTALPTFARQPLTRSRPAGRDAQAGAVVSGDLGGTGSCDERNAESGIDSGFDGAGANILGGSPTATTLFCAGAAR